MVAKAMVHNPPILVLDEPTAGVDIELRQQLWSNVRALNEKGTTILLTTHYLEEAEELRANASPSSITEKSLRMMTPKIFNQIDAKTITLRLDREPKHSKRA